MQSRTQSRRSAILLSILLTAAFVFTATAHSVAAAPLGDKSAPPSTNPSGKSVPTATAVANGKPIVTGKPADQTADSTTAGPLPYPRYVISLAKLDGPIVMGNSRDAGAEAVRTIIDWADIEARNSDPSGYYMDELDAKMNYIAAAGLTPQLLIADCPTWACRDTNGPIDIAPLSEFKQFVTFIATRYSVAPFNAHYWEFWDEPDGTSGGLAQFGWGNHGAQYAAMLVAVVPAIRAIDSQATIANGGVAYDWFTDDPTPGPFARNFLPDFLQAGGGSYIDYLAFHYEPANIHWPNVAAKVAEIRALVRSNGFTKPLVSGETALTSDSDARWSTPQWGANSLIIQSRYVIREFAENVAAGLPGLSWFTVQDFPSIDMWSAFAESGLTTLDGTPKPSFYAYRTLTQEVGQGEYVRPAASGEFGDGVTGYLFNGTEHPVWLLWSNSDTPVQVKLPRTEVVRALDMLGQAQTPQPVANGFVQITLTQDPVFVEVRSLQRFSDVPGDHFAFEQIDNLAQRGIVSGYSSNLFEPANDATRGQLAKIIALAEGWTLPLTGNLPFSDVTANNPFRRYIQAAYDRGIISGYEDGTFRYNENITRAQLAKIIVRARGWDNETVSGQHFSDVSLSNTFYRYIEIAYAHGIISGYNAANGLEFRPGNPATRAQIAKIVYSATASQE